MPPEIVVDKVAGLVSLLATRIETEGESALAARGSFSLALPGGSVAGTFFPRLACTRLDWPRVEFFWADERAVPADHPDSNYRAARTLWLDPARVPEARVHRMPAEVADLEQGAASYAADLSRVLGERGALDIVLLGMGPDGHVASLFPGHRLLGEEKARVAALEDAPKPPPRRLTLTLPTLVAASLVVVAATGSAKAAAVQEGLENPQSPLPVALVLRRARRALVLLDEEAAGQMSNA